MSYGLEGKVSLVTGAASGIGAACAHVIAAAGATVIVADRDETAATETARRIRSLDHHATSRVMDVSDEESVESGIRAIVDEFGGLDIAVNNAGISVPPASPADQATEDWRRVMAVNLDGVFFCMRAELRAMRAGQGGVITNVGSVLSTVASHSGSSAYVASKHAVVGLTRSAAVSHAMDGIRVNVIGPGYVDTPMTRTALGHTVLAERTRLHPIGRLGQPEEIAELAAWLSSDAASFVTGAYIPVDGGYTAV